MSRSYYQNSISQFLLDSQDSILGNLAKKHQHNLEDLQKNAWIKQIDFLKESLKDFQGNIYFEFSIPRMGRRVDNILIINDIIFVVEFKVGEKEYPKYAQEQVIDYCLDLANFHHESHNKTIIPILISTEAVNVKHYDIQRAINLEKCILCNTKNFVNLLKEIISISIEKEKINISLWESSIYKPTPTIIEAAQALYKGHNVEEISRSDAGAINLSQTADTINSIIENSKKTNQKSICFLTGVPGAGKTLAGLNIANERLKIDEDEHSVFLSGNGPLVEVLREALARDIEKTEKEDGKKITKIEATRRVKSFIQNIHHFRDDNLKTEQAPIEKVVVFDEAQRAWTKEKASEFMKKKKGREDFNKSEPEYLISVMNRHKDWCTIVCLIGGGQEINTGEAGLSEWIKALKNTFSDWKIYYSDSILTETNHYLKEQDLLDWLKRNAQKEIDLHLSVSVRSFRSEKVAQFVQYLLDNKSSLAKEIFENIKNNYPIFLTRKLNSAKKWLKERAKGSERIGIVASSGARRLKADGLDVKNEINPAYWFLNHKEDVRSSYYLEDIATEFDVQGLEIDYTCVAWDINLYYDNHQWSYKKFKGTCWQNINKEEDKNYLLNSYRVLLTRARQGMIIYIPEVDETDYTRSKNLYDSTFEYLKECGISELE